MEEVSLQIDNQVFKVKKELLCGYSDYFRAMFSGNYVENKQNKIKIDVVDANSMSIIVDYMNTGVTDLSAYSLSTIADLAMAANFLQITVLINQIEYLLETELSLKSWVETLTIAENASYLKLQETAVSYGLSSFQLMKPEYIPSMHRLCWYLSHPNLDTQDEFEVFKFGYNWVLHAEAGADALLMILGCLVYKKLEKEQLESIKQLLLVINLENSLACKVIELLLELPTIDPNKSLADFIVEKKPLLYEKFSERVCDEVVKIVGTSKERKLNLVPVVPLWTLKDSKQEVVPHHMHTFSLQKGLERWLEVAEKNLWGWSIVAWGRTKVVVACGEHGRGTGMFMKHVNVYDTLRKTWSQHGVQLPPRRHGGLTVVGDRLFIVGGVGGYRVVLDTALVYNLKERTHHPIAKLPDAVQSPAVCSHKGQVYMASHNSIYCYESTSEKDVWVKAVSTDIRMSCMMSYKNAIYCTQNYFSDLYMFVPGVDTRLQAVTKFSNPPAAICNLGDSMIFFTRSMCTNSDMLVVEEYTGRKNEKPRILWSQVEEDIKFNDVAGCCTISMTPPENHKISAYLKKYLRSYVE